MDSDHFDSDTQKIAFGYYVLGWVEGNDGVQSISRDDLRAKFDAEWKDTGEVGRRLLDAEGQHG